MTTLREAALQALEALETNNQAWKHLADSGDAGFLEVEEQPFYEASAKAITALRAALAEPRPIQECYGDCPTNPQTCPNPCNFEGRPRPVQEPVTRLFGTLPVYDTPSQRKPLREEKISSLFRASGSPLLFARAIERAHGITP